MAYSINPNLPKARALGMQMLVKDNLPMQIVANKCGVHRSTVWRWRRKWLELNKDAQLANYNRPNRAAGTRFRMTACRWIVPTLSSRPHFSPRRIRHELMRRILELRYTLKRCAEVIWHHLVHIDRVTVSLSSVRRILKRNHCFDGARKKRVRPENPRRPFVTRPGELVQTDTIHYICPLTKSRRYVYTAIDLYTRMAYAEIHSRILPGLAAKVVLNAKNKFGFDFAMVQADNGSEFSRFFEQKLAKQNIQTRHSRLGRPNDNAHIERFNRTIQEECLGHYLTHKITNKQVQVRLTTYLDYYNHKRVHLGLQLRVPCEMLQRF